MSTTNTETPTIRSKYTDDQLRDALITATELRERIFIRGTVGADGAYGSQHWSENQIEDLHAILNVLETLNDAESTDAGEDEWLRAESIADIRRGDMLKVEVDSLVGTYKYAVKNVSLSSKTIIFDNGDMYTWVEDDTVYRIPAPIVHPDPAEHPLIYVSRINTTGWETQDVKLIATLEKTYTNKYLAHTGLYLDPQRIVEWEPIDPGVLLERFDG